MFQPKDPDWLNGYINKTQGEGQSQGGRGIGLGDHILPDNFIKRSSKH